MYRNGVVLLFLLSIMWNKQKTWQLLKCPTLAPLPNRDGQTVTIQVLIEVR